MSNEMRYDEQDLMACKTSGLFREDAGESVFCSGASESKSQNI